MRLRRPCEHGLYDDHSVYVTGFPAVDCPGGEFLPEDAIVIEKVEGEWPESALRAVAVYGEVDEGSLTGLFRRKANKALDALTADRLGSREDLKHEVDT